MSTGPSKLNSSTATALRRGKWKKATETRKLPLTQVLQNLPMPPPTAKKVSPPIQPPKPEGFQKTTRMVASMDLKTHFNHHFTRNFQLKNMTHFSFDTVVILNLNNQKKLYYLRCFKFPNFLKLHPFLLYRSTVQIFFGPVNTSIFSNIEQCI